MLQHQAFESHAALVSWVNENGLDPTKIVAILMDSSGVHLYYYT